MDQHFGVVLAGGLSTRMGKDKSQLLWRGNSLLQHCYQILAGSQCHHIYVSHNHGEGINDRFEQCGPLGGIDAILQQLDSKGWLTVLPVDMPLIRSAQLIELQKFANQFQQACYFDQHYLPCVIPVNDDVKTYIEHELLSGGNYSIRGLLHCVNTVSLKKPEESCLINTNTPEEWEAACQKYNDDRKENLYVRS